MLDIGAAAQFFENRSQILLYFGRFRLQEAFALVLLEVIDLVVCGEQLQFTTGLQRSIALGIQGAGLGNQVIAGLKHQVVAAELDSLLGGGAINGCLLPPTTGITPPAGCWPSVFLSQ